MIDRAKTHLREQPHTSWIMFLALISIISQMVGGDVSSPIDLRTLSIYGYFLLMAIKEQLHLKISDGRRS